MNRNERGERKKCNPKPRALGPRQYDVRSDTKFKRKTEPVSKEAEEGVPVGGHLTEASFWALQSPRAAVGVSDRWVHLTDGS